MKEKLTLYIDKDIKNLAKKGLQKTAFKSLSSYVENQLSILSAPSSIVEKWSGIISKKAQKELIDESKADERLRRILNKHCK